MIAADTSTWIAFLEGAAGLDVSQLDEALANRQVLMVPAVLAELLSDPGLSPELAKALEEVPRIEIRQGYWRRAGRLRAAVLAKGRKARLGDALIAQACLDQTISLLTRDRDFEVFARTAGVRSL